MKLKMIMLSGLFFSLPVMAEPEFAASIDNSLKECGQKAVSTLDSVDCYSVAEQSWDKALNQQYRLLTDGQSPEFKAAMKMSQRAWLTYRDRYLDSLRAFYRQQQGTVWSIIMSEASMRLTRNQAIELYTLRNSTDLQG
ncbi:lysozyme inhibitor LprI family protein [Tatumella citrea]|uniref:Lysozyme inhibitor LprI-like N-terminal domain-containing protein n=1 Tax=Tatumella citrea TaxID=53336 RepID=A0A1Y0L5M0_TATCI|nr:lysozyme inhibitor LprI family protein [Tatumella citrea]ARU93342.1 hypothetical protein A7K98_05790 [Tatumella citrea]ARU97380.1 hypothetical protein A7K99_05790 [Tatumella citrea]